MADSKPVKQEFNGTVILPPLVFPVLGFLFFIQDGGGPRGQAEVAEEQGQDGPRLQQRVQPRLEAAVPPRGPGTHPRLPRVPG
jgi:hypothetical protein